MSMTKQAAEAVNMLMDEGVDFDTATNLVMEKVASANPLLKRASMLAGALASTEGHRWGGAGMGLLAGTAGGAVGGAIGHAMGGRMGLAGLITGDVLASGYAGHWYGKHAQKQDQKKLNNAVALHIAKHNTHNQD